MQLLILGRTNDDRGSQLESLTSRLLEHLGYGRVTTNLIGAGGNEIDVHAELTVPSLGGSQTYTVICECKAYERPVEMTHWLKFLGKLYYQDATTNSITAGAFIALSGVVGTVQGHFADLHSKRRMLELVTGADLLRQLQRVWEIPNTADVAAYVHRYTDREIIGSPHVDVGRSAG